MKPLNFLHYLIAGSVWLAALPPSVYAQPHSQSTEPIPASEWGAKAGAQYQGDGLSVVPTLEGARLRCVFQKLEGEVTGEGLWLVSTVEPQSREKFRVVARAVGRAGALTALLPQGVVAVSEQLARCVRPGLTEEYSVSVDGVRQDFMVGEKPGGEGPLRVELEVAGAKAEVLATGARLVLEASGRKLAYHRLRATDAQGRELPARLEVTTATRLAVVVDDATAAYPVRIDPTFSDADWISLGGLAGTDGTVRAIAVDEAGNLYIGGQFTVVGDVFATNIAKWDGNAWSALGSGIGGLEFPYVYALAVSGADLYAGGVFTTAGGVAASRIAKWNGTTWSALGSGMNYSVRALAVSGTNLYAGGDFTTPGRGMAKWDGKVWSPLSSGMDGYVAALAVSGTNLYAGGRFTTAGGTAATNIAKWNGTAWSAMGSGMGGSGVYTTVYALAVLDSTLYAGGDFTTAGGLTAKYIARWNGSAWSAVGSGMNNNGAVFALAVSGTILYAGGGFSSAGGTSAAGMAKWNGSAWSALGSGVTGGVRALAVSGPNLYAGGDFVATGGTAINRIAKWDGTAWSALGGGINGWVYALAVSGPDLYAGGQFTTAGGITVNRIAKWDGNEWSALGSGLNSVVYSLAVSGSNLYAGGQFTAAGGITVNGIAKWDGSAWSALGSGISAGYSTAYVYALAVSGTNLFAGGQFTTAGGSDANNVAQWDGSAWSALGSGTSAGSDLAYVYALAVSDKNLFAGGWFTTAGGTTAAHVAKWDGSAWSALGAGIDGWVYALTVSGPDLYAGGQFTRAGGTTATNVAKWNGSAWSALGSGMSGYASPCVYALTASGPDLYAGGYFTTAGGTTAAHIAKWDGSAWSALGSGMNNTVRALVVSGTNLYAGGGFTQAGGKVSAYVAQAYLSGATPVAPVFISIVPNPSRTQALLTFTAEPGASFDLLSSTNLTTWQTNSTVNATGATNSVPVNITQPQEFFRLRCLP